MPVEMPFAQYCKYSLVKILPRDMISCFGCVIGFSLYSNLVNLRQRPICVGMIDTRFPEKSSSSKISQCEISLGIDISLFDVSCAIRSRFSMLISADM